MPEAELDALLEEEGQLQAEADKVRTQGPANSTKGQHQRATTQTTEAKAQHLEQPGSTLSARAANEIAPKVANNDAKASDAPSATQAHSQHLRQ